AGWRRCGRAAPGCPWCGKRTRASPTLRPLRRREKRNSAALTPPQAHATISWATGTCAGIVPQEGPGPKQFASFRRILGVGRRDDVYAVIDSGGKQLRVEPGQVVEVDRLPYASGSEVALGRVLLLVDGEQVTTGTPVVPGARVM